MSTDYDWHSRLSRAAEPPADVAAAPRVIAPSRLAHTSEQLNEPEKDSRRKADEQEPWGRAHPSVDRETHAAENENRPNQCVAGDNAGFVPIQIVLEGTICASRCAPEITRAFIHTKSRCRARASDTPTIDALTRFAASARATVASVHEVHASP